MLWGNRDIENSVRTQSLSLSPILLPLSQHAHVMKIALEEATMDLVFC